MRNILLVLLSLCLYSPARGQTGYSYRCWFDNGQATGQTGVSASDGWNVDIDVSELSDGFHTLHLQVTDDKGVSSAPVTRFFYKVALSSADRKVSYCCYVDGEKFCQGRTDMDDDVLHLDLDVQSLTDGLHSLSVSFADEQGVQTSAMSQFFIKQPVGGNKISQYQYWLNDDTQQTKTATLEAASPLQLVTQLPVQPMPIRSTCFHFEVTDGQPTVYAKNDLHVRFFDTYQRFVCDSCQYVDYSVSQSIGELAMLQPGIRETTACPDENAIKWYSVEAWEGDKVQFKLSSAATLQLFDASGQELYRAAGTGATKWGGVQVADDGVYYLAIHDAESSVSTVGIDYTHDYAAQPGDVNGDGRISVTDVVGIIDHILEQTPAKFIRPVADVNGDGRVTVTDVVSVIDLILENQ